MSLFRHLIRALRASIARPYRYLWCVWIVGFTTLLIAVVFSSHLHRRPVESAVYMSAIAIMPPVIIICYAYLTDFGSDAAPASITSRSSSPSDSTKGQFKEQWQTWSSRNTKRASIAVVSPDLPQKGECCSICLALFEPDDDVRELPCRHVLHEDCFKAYFHGHRPLGGKRQHECPLCREPMGPVLDGGNR
ncbi:hypothetical protein FOZ62_013055 [Perkinsus olseni]|uniref:RING-type domain-containing protein n=2 Tax=Perkinsus olseni TaxID=32597 RepID=A0A7J6UCJ4_PEROL|nr:hypothetical protein FOZ62_013055 [Perkinsus olseni]